MYQVGRYSIVGPHVRGRIPEGATLILDANVLIDLRNFYFGEGFTDSESLRALLLRFPHSRRNPVEINYGWAATELSWVRGDGHDPSRYRRLVHAASQVLSWDVERIEMEFSMRRPPIDRDRYWPRRVSICLADDAADPRVMLIAPYGALLYLFMLERRRQERQSRGREWALASYANWMSETLGVRMTYPMSLAIGLLAGNAQSQRQARSVLKFSGAETVDDLATKAWNVAWDIAMTSLGEGISYGLLPGIRPAESALVTRDTDPWILRSASELRALLDDGAQRIPMSSFGMDLHQSVTESAVQKLFEFDPADSLSRFGRDPEVVLRQAVAAVDALEQELAVTKRTLADSWMLDS
ncbi:hypothetical protein [uncultured Microbacterium sp.]|uniref:hypothetical protein n=1 Tax=uncultured Microbacterium sp. TaxID=191216 RepID=UPI0025E81FE4|nr:hypothetical protein [uncultured Microbacterium sp.]